MDLRKRLSAAKLSGIGVSISQDECEEVIELQAENKQLKGEEPIPGAWWKDCPKLAQKTMERIIDKNNNMWNRLEEIKELADMYETLYGTDKESPCVRTMMAISGQAEQALQEKPE